MEKGKKKRNLHSRGNTLERRILFLSLGWHQTSVVIWDLITEKDAEECKQNVRFILLPFLQSLQKWNYSTTWRNWHAARHLSAEQEFGEHKAYFPVCFLLALIRSLLWPWFGQLDMNISLSKFNQSFQLLPGDRPKRTTRPQIKGEWRAPLAWAGWGDVLPEALKCKGGEGCVYMMTLCLSIKSRL